MSALQALIKRNTKLFFKDKGMFFTALVTPLILLVLYATFLSNIYRSTFEAIWASIPNVPSKLINGCVSGQLFSSLLAVCCVTVPFCSNMLMVQDKVNNCKSDLTITPVKNSTLSLGYYIATLLTSFLVCFTATGICLIYIANTGWYFQLTDILLLVLDIFLLVMFGTALSSIINFFLSTQGQISAVGTIISAGYGFLCGAYMPISQFSEGLRNVLSFLPGTYATSLLRNHALSGTFREMEHLHFPAEIIEAIKDSIDCNLYLFETKIPFYVMYIVLGGSVVLLIALYILLNRLKGMRK